jgi:hypothetical protein
MTVNNLCGQGAGEELVTPPGGFCPESKIPVLPKKQVADPVT